MNEKWITLLEERISECEEYERLAEVLGHDVIILLLGSRIAYNEILELMKKEYAEENLKNYEKC